MPAASDVSSASSDSSDVPSAGTQLDLADYGDSSQSSSDDERSASVDKEAPVAQTAHISQKRLEYSKKQIRILLCGSLIYRGRLRRSRLRRSHLRRLLPPTLAEPPTLQATTNVFLARRLLLLHRRWAQRLRSALMSPAKSSPRFQIAWASTVQSNTAKPHVIFYYGCFLIAMAPP